MIPKEDPYCAFVFDVPLFLGIPESVAGKALASEESSAVVVLRKSGPNFV